MRHEATDAASALDTRNGSDETSSSGAFDLMKGLIDIAMSKMPEAVAGNCCGGGARLPAANSILTLPPVAFSTSAAHARATLSRTCPGGTKTLNSSLVSACAGMAAAVTSARAASLKRRRFMVCLRCRRHAAGVAGVWSSIASAPDATLAREFPRRAVHFAAHLVADSGLIALLIHDMQTASDPAPYT